jgi:hypothetical protein
MANKQRKELFSGCRARILMDGKRQGWAKGVSGSREYMKEAVEVCDNVEVEEYATVGYRVNMRANLVGILTESLTGQGLMPKIGQDNDEHLKNIIAQTPFTIQIEDNVTGKIMYEYSRCEISTENFDVGARSIMGKDVSIVGIRAAE